MLETPNLPRRDPRGHLLRELDARGDDYARDCAGRALDGRMGADLDVEILNELAGRVAKDVASWRSLVDRLDLATVERFDPSRAGVLILESVFDEVLEPGAWGVLRAALDLAQNR